MCRDVYSCYKFCGADFFMDLKTPVYGPYLDMETPTEPIGYVVQTMINIPQADGVFAYPCCCFLKAPKAATLSTRYMPIPGQLITPEDGLGIGLLLMHYKDNELLDNLMSRGAPVPQVRGCYCIDTGLDGSVEHKGVIDAIRDKTLNF